MSSMLDMVSGMIIGGMILMLTITVTDSGTRQFFNYNADAIVQSNLAQIAYITEYDLRKMGYGIDEVYQSSILQVATPGNLKFLTHLNMETDVIPDTIEYNVIADEIIDYGDTLLTMYKIMRTTKISTESPDVTMIGKIGNNNVFRYLDQIGNPVEIIPATKMVEVTLVSFNPEVVLSPEYINNRLNDIESEVERKKELIRLLRPSFWRQTRLVSKNLRR